ncbi:uncharacterized protein METZ01_LOCUS507009, partial [marine metagenome]
VAVAAVQKSNNGHTWLVYFAAPEDNNIKIYAHQDRHTPYISARPRKNLTCRRRQILELV